MLPGERSGRAGAAALGADVPACGTVCPYGVAVRVGVDGGTECGASDRPTPIPKRPGYSVGAASAGSMPVTMLTALRSVHAGLPSHESARIWLGVTVSTTRCPTRSSRSHMR